MAHMIERNEDMFVTRVPAWHGLGIMLDEPPTSREAIIAGGLDWEVIQRPLYVDFEDTQRLEDSLKPVDNYLANIREDTETILGIVTNRYSVSQNIEAFDFVDNLINEGIITYETAGCLEGGKRIWLLARLPESYILGDKIDKYLCFSHGHDGQNPIKAYLTGIRVVCNNTLSFSMQSAQRIWSSKHVGNIAEKLSDAKITLGLVDNYFGSLKELAENTSRIKLYEHEVEKLTSFLFPLPDECTDRTKNNILNMREELRYRHKYAPDIDNFRYTGWGYISSVTDYVSHSKPLRETKNWRENRFSSLLEGSKIVDTAIELVLAA